MPLDFGGGADSDMVASEAVASGVHGGVSVGLQSLIDSGANIGQALRALREAKGLSLADIAGKTCIRRVYLQALEEMSLDQLPSRPFAVGYVKAYADAVGAPGDLAVRQFRKDAPSPDEALKAPAGVRKERDARLSWLAGCCVVVATAVVMWNLAQHAVAHDGAPTPPVAVTNTPPPKSLAASGPVALGAALPAPADSDVPQPYVTPGMAKAVGGPEAAADPAPAPAKVFINPHAAVYGAPANKSVVTLRALKSASLVVKGGDGSIYFARQLQPGEAFRAPANVPGLTVDAPNFQAFDVIVAGQAHAPLQAATTPIAKLAG
ncbi:MAG TPA: helix-turn-helix domain-containing protein [Caulobacteraceae bacterium]|jgi:cytoskeletal protein RodZ